MNSSLHSVVEHMQVRIQRREFSLEESLLFWWLCLSLRPVCNTVTLANDFFDRYVHFLRLLPPGFVPAEFVFEPPGRVKFYEKLRFFVAVLNAQAAGMNDQSWSDVSVERSHRGLIVKNASLRPAAVYDTLSWPIFVDDVSVMPLSSQKQDTVFDDVTEAPFL